MPHHTFEEAMSGSARIREQNSEALAIITRCEAEVGELERQVEALRAQLDLERRRLISALDELRARFYERVFSDGDKAGATAGPLSLDSFRAAQRALEEQVVGCGALMSKLNGLSNLLTVSRGQFAPQGEAT